MTYNVMAHISQMKHFLGKTYKRQSCRKLNFLQNELWLRNYWWSMWKLCLVKVQLTFPQENPNLESFDFWWIWDFLDESWSTLDQMMNMTSKPWCWPKILKFDWKLVQVDFWSNTIDCWSFEHLTEQFCTVRLETWHVDTLRYMRHHEVHLRLWKLNFLWEKQNPSCGLIA